MSKKDPRYPAHQNGSPGHYSSQEEEPPKKKERVRGPRTPSPIDEPEPSILNGVTNNPYARESSTPPGQPTPESQPQPNYPSAQYVFNYPVTMPATGYSREELSYAGYPTPFQYHQQMYNKAPPAVSSCCLVSADVKNNMYVTYYADQHQKSNFALHPYVPVAVPVAVPPPSGFSLNQIPPPPPPRKVEVEQRFPLTESFIPPPPAPPVLDSSPSSHATMHRRISSSETRVNGNHSASFDTNIVAGGHQPRDSRRREVHVPTSTSNGMPYDVRRSESLSENSFASPQRASEFPSTSRMAYEIPPPPQPPAILAPRPRGSSPPQNQNDSLTNCFATRTPTTSRTPGGSMPIPVHRSPSSPAGSVGVRSFVEQEEKTEAFLKEVRRAEYEEQLKAAEKARKEAEHRERLVAEEARRQKEREERMQRKREERHQRQQSEINGQHLPKNQTPLTKDAKSVETAPTPQKVTKALPSELFGVFQRNKQVPTTPRPMPASTASFSPVNPKQLSSGSMDSSASLTLSPKPATPSTVPVPLRLNPTSSDEAAPSQSVSVNAPSTSSAAYSDSKQMKASISNGVAHVSEVKPVPALNGSPHQLNAISAETPSRHTEPPKAVTTELNVTSSPAVDNSIPHRDAKEEATSRTPPVTTTPKVVRPAAKATSTASNPASDLALRRQRYKAQMANKKHTETSDQKSSEVSTAGTTGSVENGAAVKAANGVEANGVAKSMEPFKKPELGRVVQEYPMEQAEMAEYTKTEKATTNKPSSKEMFNSSSVSMDLDTPETHVEFVQNRNANNTETSMMELQEPKSEYSGVSEFTAKASMQLDDVSVTPEFVKAEPIIQQHDDCTDFTCQESATPCSVLDIGDSSSSTSAFASPKNPNSESRGKKKEKSTYISSTMDSFMDTDDNSSSAHASLTSTRKRHHEETLENKRAEKEQKKQATFVPPHEKLCLTVDTNSSSSTPSTAMPSPMTPSSSTVRRPIVTKAALKKLPSPPRQKAIAGNKRARATESPVNSSSRLTHSPLATIRLPRPARVEEAIQNRRSASSVQKNATSASPQLSAKVYDNVGMNASEVTVNAQRLIEIEIRARKAKVDADKPRSFVFKSSRISTTNEEKDQRKENKSGATPESETDSVGQTERSSPQPLQNSRESFRTETPYRGSMRRQSHDFLNDKKQQVEKKEELSSTLAGILYPLLAPTVKVEPGSNNSPTTSAHDFRDQASSALQLATQQLDRCAGLSRRYQYLHNAAKMQGNGSVSVPLDPDLKNVVRHPDFQRSKEIAQYVDGQSARISAKYLKELTKKYNLPKISSRFRKFIRVSVYPNGGAWMLMCDYNLIRQSFDDDDTIVFFRQFTRLGFAEFEEEAVFAICVVENGAEDLMDVFTNIATTKPSLHVKISHLTTPNLIETMKIGDYYNRVLATLDSGTFRVGGCNAVTMVGARGEEAGDYYPDVLADFDNHPLLGPITPWGEYSQLAGMRPELSDDGPIFWVRPGEQCLPLNYMNAPGKKDGGCGESSSSEKEPPQANPAGVGARGRRLYEVLDRTHCHADQVADSEHGLVTTAAVGILQAVKPPGEYGNPNDPCYTDQRNIVKEVIVFDAKDFRKVEQYLLLDLFEPPVTQCNQWLEDTRLNMMRRDGFRFAKLTLRDNDMYFMPRKVVHQFRTVAACTSVAWHVRLKHYHQTPAPTIPDPENECLSDYSDDEADK